MKMFGSLGTIVLMLSGVWIKIYTWMDLLPTLPGLSWWRIRLQCGKPGFDPWVPSLGWGDPLEKGTATHSSILAWRIPWTVQSMGSQRVRHDWVTFIFTFRLNSKFLHSQTEILIMSQGFSVYRKKKKSPPVLCHLNGLLISVFINGSQVWSLMILLISMSLSEQRKLASPGHPYIKSWTFPKDLFCFFLWRPFFKENNIALEFEMFFRILLNVSWKNCSSFLSTTLLFAFLHNVLQ